MNEVKDLNAMSDQEVSETFALEIAEWTKHLVFGDEVRWSPPGEDSVTQYECPSFATDANAVLPWLEKVTGGHYSVWYSHRLHSDTPHNYTIDLLQMPECIGHGATFPRAACCALIAAKRASK